VYTRTIAGLPDVAVCQLTQPQLSTNFSPYLPFKSKSFDVVTSRTLYKFIVNPHRPHTLEPKLWVQEVHRILDKGGNFEFFFVDSRLSHAGPLTSQMEPHLYDNHRLCSCGQTYQACACTTAAVDLTAEAMTGTQFLELLASEGFATEKCTTLMFPFSLLSSVFTRDGQRLKVNQADSGSGRSEVTPLLASLIKTIDQECRETQTAWRCIIGSARKK
jgi:SAM-dependent methyltransferase